MKIRMFFARMGCMRPATAGELYSRQLLVGPALTPCAPTGALLLTWQFQTALRHVALYHKSPCGCKAVCPVD